jgi:dolichyl-diphosphooligosaccharide--protein glycosyltransferase
LFAVLVGGFSILWQFGYMRGVGGKFILVINPSARGAAPLIESVAEHRISAWGPIYYDLGIVVVFFLAGFFFVLRDLNDKNLFLLIFGLTSLYFACSMVRLLVVLAPAFSLLAAIGITGILKPFNTLLKEPPKISVKKKYGLQHVGKEFSGAAVFLIFLILMTNFAFPMPKVYNQASSPVTITASSLPISHNYTEWLDMLQWTNNNLKATTVVCSWWDYGYWLTIMGNVTTLADNGTINSTQIQNIGFTFMANETQALKMLKQYDAKYILVFTTLALRQSGEQQYSATWAGFGDEGKWTWMACISGQGNWTNLIAKGFIDEQSTWTSELSDVRRAFGNYTLGQDGVDTDGDGRIDSTVDNVRRQNTLIYKLMSWGAHAWCSPRGVADPDTAIQPEYFKEAYFAGVEGNGYGGIIPLVCLYEIDYPS